jgi:hypothetical protein
VIRFAVARRFGRSDLLYLDFLLPCALEVFRRASELRHRLSQRFAELGQLARAENDQRDYKNEYNLSHS